MKMVHEKVRPNARMDELVRTVNQMYPSTFSSIAVPVWYRVAWFVWEGAAHESSPRE